MTRQSITLVSPDHPLLEDMVEELSGDVDYSIRGPRFRRGGAGNGASPLWRRLAQQMAARIRGTAGGALLYQRVKAMLYARPGPNGQMTHAFSQLGSGGPWIGDYENVNVLAFYSPRVLKAPLFRAGIRRALASSHCRAVRVWSEMGRRSFESVFGADFVREKVVVVHPAIRFPDLEQFPPNRPGGPIRLLFIGRGFWVKGGAIFLEAIRRLKKRHLLAVDFICDVPDERRWEYADLEPVVTFHRPEFTREALYKRFYSKCDVFVMLGMADSYGSVMLEAAAFSLPVIAMRLNSGLTDILRQTRNAIQIEPPLQLFDSDGVHLMEPSEMIGILKRGPDEATVERLMDAVEQLVASPERRREMGFRGQQTVKHGDLSASVMRTKLLELYATATHAGNKRK